MAKKGKGKRALPMDKAKPKESLAGSGLYEFELQSGEVITYKPMNPDLRQAILDRYPLPDIPLREVETVDGGIERIENPSDPQYQAVLSEANRSRAEALTRLLMIQCLDHLEPPNGWIEKQQWIMPGWQPPDDLLARKQYWMEHWLLGPLDLASLVQAAMLASALTPQEVERQLKSFRSEVARTISEELGDTIREALTLFRTGTDTGGGMGEDSVADIRKNG